MDRCRFPLDELRYQYPEERDDPAMTPQKTHAGNRSAVCLGLRMVKGLANIHAAAIVSARADEPFASIEYIGGAAMCRWQA